MHYAVCTKAVRQVCTRGFYVWTSEKTVFLVNGKERESVYVCSVCIVLDSFKLMQIRKKEK